MIIWVLLLLFFWRITEYYSGPVAEVIGWMCLILLGIVVIVWISGLFRRRDANMIKHAEKSKYVKSFNPDTKPRVEDFIGCVNPQIRCNIAVKEWEIKRRKQITYEIPVSEIPTDYETKSFFLKEIISRNPKRELSSVGHTDIDPRCVICGKVHSKFTKYSHVHNENICDTCEKNLIRAMQPNSGYKLPSGFDKFSPSFWVYQMMILVDLSDGIIDQRQAQRETEIAARFELHDAKVQKHIQYRRQEAEQRQKQSDILVTNIANSLLS